MDQAKFWKTSLKIIKSESGKPHEHLSAKLPVWLHYISSLIYSEFPLRFLHLKRLKHALNYIDELLHELAMLKVSGEREGLFQEKVRLNFVSY